MTEIKLPVKIILLEFQEFQEFLEFPDQNPY